MKEVHPFEPIYDENSKILILGSFPSVKSREANFYYSNPQNRFWRVLAKIYKQKEPKSPGEKRKFLLDNNIALWDVVKSCEIDGSADSTICNEDVNDIPFLLENTKIDTIYFNGKIAFTLFKRHYKDRLNEKVNIELLPSSSSANANFTFDKLYSIWRKFFSNSK